MLVSDTNNIKQQHFDSYKRSVIDIIENNSRLLFDDDINSLIKKPPLNSMDKIKNKYLSVAKKNELVVETEKLEECLKKYREDVINKFAAIIRNRIDYYTKIVNKCKINNNIKILKRDINIFNKKMKKNLKDIIISSINKNLCNNTDKIIKSLNDKDIKDINKYLNNMYIKDLMENVDIKILVKDATMINSIKEATDTYLFTISNSRLFD